VTDCYATNNGKRDGDFSYTTGCPAGYTLSGGTCNLSNSAQVVKPMDGQCTIIRSGNSFSGDPLDPDCAVGTSGSAAQLLGASISSTTVSATQAGHGGSVQVDAATGVTTVRQSTPDTSGGTTTTRTTSVTAPPGGTGTPTIQGIAVQTHVGSGTLHNPSASEGFDTSELSKETTTQGVKSSIDGLRDDLKGEGVTESQRTLTAAHGDLDAASAARQGAVEGVLTDGLHMRGQSWSWLGGLPSVESCEPQTFTFLGAETSWDFCPMISIVKGVLSFMLYVMFGWGMLNLLTRGPT